MVNTYIYLRVDGQGFRPLPFPQNDLGRDLILLQVKRWVKSLRGFDPYDSSLSMRVINRDGEVLYSLSTGHAYTVTARVEHAIDYCNAQKADMIF